MNKNQAALIEPGAEQREADFKAWMMKQIQSKGRSKGKPYIQSTINHYTSNLKNTNASLNELGDRLYSNLFNYASADEFETVSKVIFGTSNFAQVNSAHHNSYSCAMKLYARFLKEHGKSTDPNQHRADDIVEGEVSPYEDAEIPDPNGDSEIHCPKYSENDFLSDVFISAEKYANLKGLLLRKKNVILQGAPGVGKTFASKRLAFSIMGMKDTSRIKVIQFHQSYSYEDFVMGYRPDGSCFRLAEGPFYKFCKLAEGDDEHKYFFIIDEINRGNLSKIFGELLMLIEADKRGQANSLGLLYKDEQFFVPDNVYIIGIMNTADRSLAMIDYALRRRFAFFDMEPAFLSDGFKKLQVAIQNPKFDSLLSVVENLNNAISDDPSLGVGFRIGHSYFLTSDPVDDVWLSSVVEYELIPLLFEYWFDEPSKIEIWSKKLRGALRG